MASIITNKLRRAISEAIYDDIFSRRNNYYYYFNRVDPGYSLETTPLNTLEYETFVRNNMVAAKRIYSSDVAFVVPRFNWVSGTTYTQYNILLSGQSTLAGGPKFYVYDDVNYRVYKCISNNNNSPSTVKPGSIALTATSAEEVTYSDGYTWKYMYSIPKTLRNKFLTADYIPVLTALQKRYYSDGGIGEITIVKAGTGYVQGTTTITVTGDGSGAVLEPVIVGGKLGNIIVKNPGRDYTRAVITINSAGGGTGAEAVAEVNRGDLDSDQALVELLTIPGTVDTIEVTNGGAGYITASVKIEGDGSGAQAQAVIVGDAISEINVTNKGSGYTWAKVVITSQVSPAVTTQATTRVNVSPFLGHGRNAIEELFSNTLMFYGNISSDRLSDFDVVNAYKQFGIIKNIRNLDYSTNVYDQVAENRYQVEADFGPKVEFFGGSGTGAKGTVNVTGKFISDIQIEDAGTGFSSAPTVNITGSGATTIELILGGSTDFKIVKTVYPYTTANLTIGAKLTAVGGYIASDTYITSITDYRTFTISKNAIAASQANYAIETTASAVAKISASVNSLTLGFKGVGYSSQPALIFPSTSGYGASATSTIGSGVGAISITNQGSGYTSAPAITFNNTGTNGSGAAATAYVSAGKVVRIEVTNPGSGYTSAPTISFGGPGSAAAGTPSLTYVVSDIAVASGGQKYESAPAVEFSGSTGVHKVDILDPGTGFTSAPTVTISGGGGSGATGTAYIEDVVRSISITNGGSGYVTAPSVSISGTGTSATATAVISGGKVVEVIITNRGGGYTSASVTFSAPPAGTTATGSVTVGRGVVAINITSPGTGYVIPPVISLSGAGVGSGYSFQTVLGKATATSTVSGSLKSITLTNSGNNYTATPTISFTGGGGTGASAYAKVVGYIDSITVDYGGSGYTSAPTVMISGGEGSGATAVANISGGAVQTVSISKPGNGYVTTTFADFPIGTILVDTNLNEFEVHSAKTNGVMDSLLLTSKDGIAISGVVTLRKKLAADYFITNNATSHKLVESRFPVACYKVRGEFNLVDFPAGTELTLTDQTNGDKQFIVISGRDITTEKELLIVPTNGGTINNGVTLSNGTDSFSVSTYDNPEIDRRTGDILMISNSNSTFTQNSDQTLSFRTIVNF